MSKLTASQRFLLNEVDSMPDKIVRTMILRQTARHMTDAGFYRVVDKMVRLRLLAREADKVTITFGGQQALVERA